MLYIYVLKGYVRKIIIVNVYFSGWFVYNVLNWCEIEREREGLCLGGQSEVRLLHSMQLISITENVCTFAPNDFLKHSGIVFCKESRSSQ